MPITVAAISLDGKELAKSASVLIVRLTDVSNTGMLFGNKTRQLVKKTGALPLLLRRGSATVEFADGRPCKITALNCDGAVRTVESTFKDGICSFRADTALFPGGVMACRLTR